ncbi:hypothetical protein D3C87_1970400 [compost metagenome]
MQLAQVLRRVAVQALVEHTTKDRVVAVGKTLALPVLDEQVLTLQLSDQSCGMGVAAQVGRKLGIEGIDHRSSFQKGQQCRG